MSLKTRNDDQMPTAATIASLLRKSIENRMGRSIRSSLIIKQEYATILLKASRWITHDTREALISNLENHGYRDVAEQI